MQVQRELQGRRGYGEEFNAARVWGPLFCGVAGYCRFRGCWATIASDRLAWAAGQLPGIFLCEELGSLALDFALVVGVQGGEDLGCGNGHDGYSLFSGESW